MISFETFKEQALSYPETTEERHFEKPSFRVKKKIFATYDQSHHRATLKLSPGDQDLFSLPDPESVCPIPNKWGQQGWTFVELDKVKQDLFMEALKCAYCEVAPKSLSDLVKK